MNISIKNASPDKIHCDLLVKGIFQGNGEEIKGEKGETLLFFKGKRKILLLGLGEKEKFNADVVREMSAVMMKEAKKLNVSRIAAAFHQSSKYIPQIVEGAILGGYEFKGYKKKTGLKHRVKELIILDEKRISIIESIICAECQNRTRDLVNAPANLITPGALADWAKKMARENKLYCKVSDPKRLKFGAMLSVTAGSKQPAKVVILKYNGSKSKEIIGLVGKGITFDSGGISIKPSNKLWEMKTDMAGAAAVIEIMRGAAQLKIKKNLIAIIPICENMPDGGAARPGDVVASHSGKTIEIISTDAEGRMILVDALNYAQKLGAKKLIDIATLTGGCVVALGDAASGIMGNDDEMVSRVIDAGKKCGEKMWRLPLFDEYKDYLKSEIADIKNCSEGRGASPCTGGIFIKEFIGDTPWAHLDIAGTAYHHKKGATGAPVRSILKWLSDL